MHGRIDISRFPQPQLIMQRPVVIYRQVQALQPICLWVPPGHRQNWRKSCRDDGACATPVYFVQERWYLGHVVRGGPPDRRGDRSDDRHDDRGHGHGQRKGKGKGNGRGHD
ncbi:MAG: hypothetical protein QE285_03805 [Aquabacterium sp.]|nr:hypothetical protein [Aquabacterium sp.]